MKLIFVFLSCVQSQILLQQSLIKNLWQLNNCCQNMTCVIPYGCIYFNKETEIVQNKLNLKELCTEGRKYSKEWSREEFLSVVLANSNLNRNDVCTTNGINVGCNRDSSTSYLQISEFCVDPPPPPFSPLNILKAEFKSTPEYFSSISRRECCDLNIGNNSISLNIIDFNKCLQCGVKYNGLNFAASYRVNINLKRNLYYIGERVKYPINFNESSKLVVSSVTNSHILPSLYVFENNEIVKTLSNDDYNDYCSPGQETTWPNCADATFEFGYCCEIAEIESSSGMPIYKYSLNLKRNYVFYHDKRDNDAFLIFGVRNKTNIGANIVINKFEIYSELMPPAPPPPPLLPPVPNIPPYQPPPPPSPPPSFFSSFPDISKCQLGDISCIQELDRFNYFGRNINSSPLNYNSNERKWDKSLNTVTHLNSGKEKCEPVFPTGIDVNGFCITTFYFPVCKNRENIGCSNENEAAYTDNLNLFLTEANQDNQRGIYGISMKIKLIRYGPQNGVYDDFNIITSHFDVSRTGIEFLDRGLLSEKLVNDQIRTVQGVARDCDCFGISLPFCDLCEDNPDYSLYMNKIVSADLKIHMSDLLNDQNPKSSMIHIGMKISTASQKFTSPGGTKIQILGFSISYSGSNF